MEGMCVCVCVVRAGSQEAHAMRRVCIHVDARKRRQCQNSKKYEISSRSAWSIFLYLYFKLKGSPFIYDDSVVSKHIQYIDRHANTARGGRRR